MGIRMTETGIHSSESGESARCCGEGWEVTWLPERVLDRNSAITALVLSELYLKDPPEGSKWWYVIRGFEEEIGIDERHRPHR